MRITFYRIEIKNHLKFNGKLFNESLNFGDFFYWFLIRFLIQHKCTTRGTGLERATRAPMGGMSLPNGSLDGSACSTDGVEFPETATDD